MRANHRLQRLFVEADLVPGQGFAAAPQHVHYLLNVLRMNSGSSILVFNGRDGEWRADLDFRSKKSLMLAPVEQTRTQTVAPDLVLCFAPLKSGRLDYMVQKAVEMGAGSLQPVLTQHTQAGAPSHDKMLANAIEAAEQCGSLSVPSVQKAIRLDDLISSWDQSRRLIFCDEATGTANPLPGLSAITERRLAVLIGPEGGFSDPERLLLSDKPFVTAIPLGPRILRADTAAVAALAVIQATIGDW